MFGYIEMLMYKYEIVVLFLIVVDFSRYYWK